MSLLYGELAGQMNEEEERENDFCAARCDSNYAHSPIAKSALIESCASLMIEFNAQIPYRIVVSDVSTLDVNSVDLLKHLYHLHRDESPDLLIAYNPIWPDDEWDYENGLCHFYGHDTVTVLQAFVYAFEEAADQLIDLRMMAETAVSQPATQHDTLCEPELTPEYEAFVRLSANVPFSAEEAERTYQAIIGCFRQYDFFNTLFLGLRAREKIFSQLTHAQRAELLHVLGLSAHIRHFFTQENSRLADFLHQIFVEALQYETRLLHRIALCYRLVVTFGRRKNDIQRAYSYLSIADTELPELLNDKLKIARAWLLNIHSYLLMKENKLEEAIARHEEAIGSVFEIDVEAGEVYVRELEFTKAILAENLATLTAIKKDYTSMQHWLEIETAFSARWPFFHASARAEWQSLYFRQHKLKQARLYAEEGLLLCSKSFNYVLAYYFRVSLAEITSRMGMAHEAASHYEKSYVYCTQIGHSYPEISALYLLHSAVSMHLSAGNYSRAAYWLEQIQRLELTHTPAQRIALLVLNAQLAGIQKDTAGVDACMNEAIELAVNDGGSDIFFTTLLEAGRICTHAKRNSEAASAFTQAAELLTLELSGLPFKPPVAELALLYLGLAQTGDIPLNYLPDAVSNLAAALPNHTASWSILPELVEILSKLSPHDLEKLTMRSASAIKEILSAAEQRQDCISHLNIIHSYINR
ncbi:MAG: hypothetical protein IM638_00545 [Bacteroidetes bacterium]|nr:hypothetical protein [Bacteroidota bacterium]